MAKETEIAANRWLEVREEVLATLRSASPRSDESTRLKMAEALIANGQIDIQFISDAIDERNREREEFAQRARDEQAKKKPPTVGPQGGAGDSGASRS